VAKTDWRETDGEVASVERHRNRSSEWYTIVFTYKVDDHWYGGTYTSFDEYRKGDSLPLKYDPADPARNNLVERETKLHWLKIIGLVLLGIAVISIWLMSK